MKQLFTLFTFLLLSIQSPAQHQTDYYRAEKAASRKQQNQLYMRFAPYLAPQWYLMSEGFVRVDRGKLDQSLNGLLATSSVARLGWSVGGGVTFRNKWALEAGLAQSPVHNDARINSRPPVSVLTRSDRSNVFLRGKWAVLSTSRQGHRSGFWLTGGLWALPNKGDQKENFSVTGYNRRDFDTVDKLTLSSRTQASGQLTGLLELGLEYRVRLSRRVEAGTFARYNWGLSDVLTTRIAYQINDAPAGQTTLRAQGSGSSFGFTMRYLFGRPEVSSKSLYQLQGNGGSR